MHCILFVTGSLLNVAKQNSLLSGPTILLSSWMRCDPSFQLKYHETLSDKFLLKWEYEIDLKMFHIFTTILGIQVSLTYPAPDSTLLMGPDISYCTRNDSTSSEGNY